MINIGDTIECADMDDLLDSKFELEWEGYTVSVNPYGKRYLLTIAGRKKGSNNNMMPKEKIVESWKKAEKPKKQVEVLADLNHCSKQDIIRILYDAGVLSGQAVYQYRKAGMLPAEGDIYEEAAQDIVYAGIVEEEVEEAVPVIEAVVEEPVETENTSEAEVTETITTAGAEDVLAYINGLAADRRAYMVKIKELRAEVDQIDKLLTGLSVSIAEAMREG